MQPERQSQPSPGRNGNVISRQIYSPESIALFKLCQIVAVPLPVCKMRVDQVADTAVSSRTNGVRHQRVGWRLIAMADLRNDVHQTRLNTRLVRHHSDKSDQFLADIGADKGA